MNQLRGFAAIIVSAIAFGVSTSVVKDAMNLGLEPLAFSVASMLFVVAFMLPYFFTLKQEKLTRRDWRDFAVLGVVASGVAHFAYTVALDYTSAINFSFLTQTGALFTVVFAFFMLGERVKKWHLAAGAVMLAGAFLVSTGGESLSLGAGDLIVIGGSLLLGFSNAFAKRLMKRHAPGAVAFWRSVFGLASLALVALVLRLDVLAVVGWHAALNGLMIALIFVFIYIAFDELGASLGAMLMLVAPVCAVAMAMLFLGETLLLVQAAGGILILLGAVVIYRS
ncbi:MAG: DMT family transporter [Candidatus Diapherotrites archaeon]|nr:DMT family transporter [Candidatus Diapherotrites archaeon]